MEGTDISLRRRLSLTAEMVAFPHTVFALPFAFLGMILGAHGWPTIGQFVWITIAMVGARTAAMAFNRIVDRHLDADNPRTRARPLASGRLSTRWAVAVLLVSAIVFVTAAGMLSPLCLWLSPIALAIVFGYSMTKRFTWMSHLALGLALAVSPVGAWIAVSGPRSWVPALLAVSVILWTSGFDIIYACQDVSFDRGRGLYSIPARFGVGPALRLSSILHALMIGALVAVAGLYGLGAIYLVGIVLAAGILIHEHRIVRPDDLSRVNVAFFTLNGWISVIILLAAALDLAL